MDAPFAIACDSRLYGYLSHSVVPGSWQAFDFLFLELQEGPICSKRQYTSWAFAISFVHPWRILYMVTNISHHRVPLLSAPGGVRRNFLTACTAI